MEPLTQRQMKILEFIKEQIFRRGLPPTVREIASHFRMASTFGVCRHLKALERKGYIERSFNASRGIRLSQELRELTGLPIVGQVAAGTPITAIENLDGYLSIENLFSSSGDLFCLRVKGDSMVDAGIWDGDYVVVRQRSDFEDGQIGVAVVDGEATVKKLRRVGSLIELIPANENYEVMRVDPLEREFRYAGEVVGMLRSFNVNNSRHGGG